MLFVGPSCLRSEVEPPTLTFLLSLNVIIHVMLASLLHTGQAVYFWQTRWHKYTCMTWFMKCCTNEQFHVCYFSVTWGQYMKSFGCSALYDSNNLLVKPQLKGILNTKSVFWISNPYMGVVTFLIKMYSNGDPVSVGGDGKVWKHSYNFL